MMTIGGDMGTHTRGPWEVDGPCHGRYFAWGGDDNIVFENASLADARVAAAAPELLEALRPFAAFACEPLNSCDGDQCHNCRAAAVIAKAEGSA